MIESVVKTACASIFEGRFYPISFVQKDGGLPRWPAGRYTIIDRSPSETVCGTDDESTDDVRVQIDVVANTLNELTPLVTEVVTAMQDLEPPCSRDSGPRYTFDAETRTYRAIIDYIFYPSTEATS